ncbi:MAG TPA: hypothetical protein VFB04_11095 [Terriglobales bacterium]|nr:hypothetical protein [Terriglobales bacterium]
MKRVLSIALLMLSCAIVAAAQTSMSPGMQNAPARKSPLAGYAGSWIGTFQGHPWITVKLNEQGDHLIGTLQRAHDLQFQNSGDLKSVGQEQTTSAVEKAVLLGDGLVMTVKDPSTQQSDLYVMRLMSANTAELKMSGMAMQPGMPKPKPWQLSRVGAQAITPVR